MTSLTRFVAPGSLFAVLVALLVAAGCGDSGHVIGSTGTGGGIAGAAGMAGAGSGGATGGSGGRGGDATGGTGGATGGAIAGSGGGAGTGTGGTASGGRGGAGATGGAIAGSGGGAGRGGTGGGGGLGGAAGRGGTGGGGAGVGGAAGRGGTGGASGGGGAGGAGGAICGGSPGIPCASGLVCDIDNPNKCGSGSVTGHCITLPGGCTADVNPVCGCDGKTYSNDCERQRARMQLDHAGACVTSSCAVCNVATTYCQVTIGGIAGSPPAYNCVALPAGCGSIPSCTCLSTVSCGSLCTTGAGGILTVTCAVP